MLYVVLFEDEPTLAPALRSRHMPAHLSFLRAHAAWIKAAGPLQTAMGEPAGGLWLVEAEDQTRVDDLVKEDPFWPTGLRRSVRILHWSQVFASGQCLA
jgi:uncharacterized protein YciI